jgi:hypothetical protein
MAYGAVEWELVGDSLGAELSATSTGCGDWQGATVSLTSWTLPGRVTVKASMSGADSLTFAVDVDTDTVGTIDVDIGYSGQLRHGEYGTHLFAGKDCAAVATPATTTGYLQAAEPVSTTSVTPQLIAVPAGSAYTVAVVGWASGIANGSGCASGVIVTAGAVTDVSIDVEYL